MMTAIDRSAPVRVAEIVLSLYVGERCKFCGYIYGSVYDLRARQVVWTEYGRLACLECWEGQEGTQ